MSRNGNCCKVSKQSGKFQFQDGSSSYFVKNSVEPRNFKHSPKYVPGAQGIEHFLLCIKGGDVGLLV